MTSKEIITKYAERCSWCMFFNEQEFETLQKDAEVLNLLKKYFKYAEKSGLYMIEKCFYEANENYGEGWEEHNKEYEIIKEWLKNENRK